MSLGHMTYQNLDFHRTHNKEQGMNYGLELIDLANLDDKLELLHIDCGCFNQRVVDFTISPQKPETECWEL